MIVTSKRLAVAMLLALPCGAVSTARADVIVYTETFLATGSLGGTSFTNQAITLTADGDLSTLFRSPALAFVDAPAATVAIAGFATANLSDTLDVFVAYNPAFGGIFGFTDFSSPTGGDILDVRNPAFLTYDLRTPIGPIVGSFADFMSLNNPVATTAGDLVFTSVGDQVTVLAVPVQTIPEPASIVITATGVLGLLGWKCRRRARGMSRCSSR